MKTRHMAQHERMLLKLLSVRRVIKKRNKNQIRNARALIKEMFIDKTGTKNKAALRLIENVIASRIASDEKSLRIWNEGGIRVVARHFRGVMAMRKKILC